MGTPRSIAALLALTAVALAGCGYRFVRYGGGLGDVKSVSIRALRNETYEPGVERVVSEALRREFLRRGAVEVTDDPASADLVLSGKVAKLTTAGRSFDSVILALEYQLTIDVDLTATTRDGTKIAIDERSLRETERYLASADIEAQRKNREEAVRRVASVLAGRVHDALYEVLAP